MLTKVLHLLQTVMKRPLQSGISAADVVVHSPRVVKLKDCSDADLEREALKAAQFLKEGLAVALPTDTIYGLAVDAQNSSAVRHLYQIKGRQNSKPLAICVGDVEDVYLWGQVPISLELLKDLLPGPVTIVLERTEKLNPVLNPSHRKVGIRIPDLPFVRQVAQFARTPLALTSANRSNDPSCIVVEEFRDLWPSLAAVLDGGKLGTESPLSRLGSTVVDVSAPGAYTIIREGSALRQTVMKLEKHGLTKIDENLLISEKQKV